MNQILDTGEEQFKNNNINYGNYNQNKKQKVYKEKSVIEINKNLFCNKYINFRYMYYCWKYICKRQNK